MITEAERDQLSEDLLLRHRRDLGAQLAAVCAEIGERPEEFCVLADAGSDTATVVPCIMAALALVGSDAAADLADDPVPGLLWYVCTFHQKDGGVWVVHERHPLGLFGDPLAFMPTQGEA